jgi:hypothetical protein
VFLVTSELIAGLKRETRVEITARGLPATVTWDERLNAGLVRHHREEFEYTTGTIDEPLDAWPRYTIPGSRASVALPTPPRFTSERLLATPCGDLTRTGFTVQGTFGRYEGAFIALTPKCASDPSHRVGLRFVVLPRPGPEWREDSKRGRSGVASAPPEEAFYRNPGPPARFRRVRFFTTGDAVLGVLAEGDDTPVDLAEADKFFRWVRVE